MARGTKMEKRVDDSEYMKWGPAEALVIFDVIFFANYALGWLLTYIYNHDAIDDNNVSRIYLVYNICIGVDSFPARPICALVFTFSFIFYAFSCYLHWIKIYFDGEEAGIPLWVASIWLGIAFLLTLTFTLTFAVPPQRDDMDSSAEWTYIHVLGFGMGLSGYALLKCFAVMKFLMLGLFNCRDTKGQIYFWSFIFQIVIMSISVIMLFRSISDTTALTTAIDGGIPAHIGHDIAGNFLVVVAFVGPIIQYIYVPDELRNTAHIIDATQDSDSDQEAADVGQIKKMVRVDESGWLKWGPAEALVYFDVLFFSNYALGWLLTWIYNPEGMSDNNVTRIFKVYNICIGVDTFPARPICALVYTMAFIFYAASCYLHWLKIYFDGYKKLFPLWVSTIWLAVAFFLTLTFTLTFAVPPVGERDTLIHVGGFGLGLTGYVMLKLFAMTKFLRFGLFDWSDVKGQVYFWSFAAQVLIMGVAVTILFQALSENLSPLLKENGAPIPDHIGNDHSGNFLVLVAMVGPIIQYTCAPKELLNTAQIIDATQEESSYVSLTAMGREISGEMKK